jgi:CDP-diacylglycerol--glycerol-3-phosphate 3-phosphatidyltransferase
MFDRRQLPILITWGRVLSVPLMLLCFYLLPAPVNGHIACFIFTAAGLSDGVDGYLARKWQAQTPFGAFLDPVADKVMVAVALLVLCAEDGRMWILLPAIIIVSRELVVQALREWMAAIGASDKVKVVGLAKLKTILQMVAIAFLLYRDDTLFFPIAGFGLYDTGVALLVIAAALTAWTMVDYLRAASAYLHTGQQR